jgi:hypothetical protein
LIPEPRAPNSSGVPPFIDHKIEDLTKQTCEGPFEAFDRFPPFSQTNKKQLAALFLID